MLEHYEARGVSVSDKDGNFKGFETLEREALEKELQQRAEANLKK